MLYGRDPVFPIDTFLKSARVRYDVDQNYVSELLTRLNSAFSKAQQNLAASQQAQAYQFNKKAKDGRFQLGDLVYLYDPSIQVGLPKKLNKP